MNAPKAPSVIDEAYEHYVTTKIGDVVQSDEQSLRRFAQTYARYLRGWLPPDKGAAILDVGCGHGNMLYALRTWGYSNCVGIDRSPEQVALARRQFPATVQGDALEFLDQRAEDLDCIFAIDLLEHLPLDDALRFLKACHSALRTEGRLVLQLPNAGAIRGSEVVWGDITHCRAYSVSAVRQMLKLGGFQEVAFRETGPVVLGPTSLIRWFLWWVARCFVLAYDLAETGRCSEILTRTMLVQGIRLPRTDGAVTGA
jgi:2-polyprenyl-3-methyl-5-hydroxy-6-metoxy-1,4-benzoquinol methylase